MNAESERSSYRSLYDLPELAGLCSMDDAVASNWSVGQSVVWLKWIHYSTKRLSEILVTKICSEPIYELKTLLSHHAYLFAEQADSVRRRVSEMREPPLGLEQIPHDGLKQALDELEFCDETEAFLHGVYQVVLPGLVCRCRDLKTQAHPLADAPTVRLAKLIIYELEEMETVGQQACKCLTDNRVEGCKVGKIETWGADLQCCLEQSQSALADPSEQVEMADSSADLPARFYSNTDREHSFVPKRDSRYRDPYNGGVNPEAFLYSESYSAKDKTLMMYYKRIRELDVPEMMASVLTQLRDEEPWEFYYEMVRQLWDEARHAMMGEVGFVSLDLDWTKIPINFTWSLNLNSQLTARERHGVLFFIEQGLMPKTGKKYEWEIGKESGDSLSRLFQDFDWADEVLHAQIGRRWYVPKFDSLKEALDYGDKAWSKVMSHWSSYREEGLTTHRNWWPELYVAACQKWGVEPNPKALAFDENYADSRADLKRIQGD